MVFSLRVVNKEESMILSLASGFTSSDIDVNDKERLALFVKLKREYSCIYDAPTCLPLKSLGSDKYILKKGIILTLSKHDDEYTASYEPLGVYEYADNISELISSSQEYLRVLYERLIDTPDNKLSEEMLAQKKHFKKIIQAD
jgi:hypothetical protein